MEKTEDKTIVAGNNMIHVLFQTRDITHNRVTSPAIIGIILGIIAVGILIMMTFERYIGPILESRILFRVILLGIIANVCIMMFIIYSFSRVTFAIGPRGPDGIRGRIGAAGANASINKCSKQVKSISSEKNSNNRKKTIVIQKPAIE